MDGYGIPGYPLRMEKLSPGSDPAAYYGMRVREDGNVPMHWHNFFEFDFIDDGHCRQVLNGAGTECGKGALTVLCSSDFHAYRIDPEKGEFMSTYSFHFDGHFPDSETLRLLGSLSGKQIDCSGDGTFSAVKDEFVMLFSETGSDRPERDAMVRNIIARITLLAFRACGSGTAKMPPVYPEIGYIEAHFREQITEGQVADHIGFSAAWFSKLFSRRYGISFQEYLLNRRLKHAYGLITGTDAPITGICFESGFNSHSYFCRRFRKRYGVSPKGLRQSTRPDNS